jgi:hypothetical protein
MQNTLRYFFPSALQQRVKLFDLTAGGMFSSKERRLEKGQVSLEKVGGPGRTDE